MTLQDSKVWFAVVALTLTLAPFAHAGLSNQTKCDSGKLLAAAKFSQCRIKVDFIALKKGDKLSAEKKAAMEGKCDIKLNAAFVKLEEMYPSTAVTTDPWNKCSEYGDAANMIAGLVAMSDAVADGSVSTEGSGALATLNDQDVCEAAGGTWDVSGSGSVCIPRDDFFRPRDCFREGACGANGLNYGPYVGGDISSTGCSDTTPGSDSYFDGVAFTTDGLLDGGLQIEELLLESLVTALCSTN